MTFSSPRNPCFILCVLLGAASVELGWGRAGWVTAALQHFEARAGASDRLDHPVAPLAASVRDGEIVIRDRGLALHRASFRVLDAA